MLKYCLKLVIRWVRKMNKGDIVWIMVLVFALVSMFLMGYNTAIVECQKPVYYNFTENGNATIYLIDNLTMFIDNNTIMNITIEDWMLPWNITIRYKWNEVMDL